MDVAHSSLGWTSDVYARSLTDGGASLRLRLLKPRVELAFLAI